MSAWVIHVWYFAIVSFAECSAREDVCGCEAGGLFYAVKEEDLVGR
jgi:hypothetical protein